MNLVQTNKTNLWVLDNKEFKPQVEEENVHVQHILLQTNEKNQNFIFWTLIAMVIILIVLSISLSTFCCCSYKKLQYKCKILKSEKQKMWNTIGDFLSKYIV